jgi:hypothetical protein
LHFRNLYSILIRAAAPSGKRVESRFNPEAKNRKFVAKKALPQKRLFAVLG